MSEMDEYAISILEGFGKTLTIDMTETIRRGCANVIACGDDGVLIYNVPAHAYMMFAENTNTTYRFCDMIRDSGLCVCHHDYEIRIVTEWFGYSQSRICGNWAYYKNEKIDIDPSVDIRELDDSYSEFISENYSGGADVEHIHDLMEMNGCFLGAFVDGKLAGFIGKHSEQAIGLLEVLPEYQKMGLAYALEGSMINRELEQGFIPYCQVFADNEASIKLQEKLGCEKGEAQICWLYREDEEESESEEE